MMERGLQIYLEDDKKRERTVEQVASVTDLRPTAYGENEGGCGSASLASDPVQMTHLSQKGVGFYSLFVFCGIFENTIRGFFLQ